MPYQSTPEDRRRAYIIGAIYIVLAVVLGTMLFLIWPPLPWPFDAEKDKATLASILKDTGCPIPSPSPTPSPTPTTTPPTPTPTATQPATPGGGRQGTQPTTQPGTTQPATGTTQPGGQPATQTPANGPTTTTGGTTPPVTTPSNQPADEIVTIPMNLIVKRCVPTTFDERLLLLVIVAGMLGAFVHGATSLADYLGNNAFNKNWTWFYLLRPAIGMALALVFYFAIRGGFLSTTGGAKDINPYGIAALAGMVGMFSKQATDKLSEVFGALFRAAPGEGDDKRAGSLDAATASGLKLEPPSAVAGGTDFTLTVNGTGFVNGATINLDDKAQPTTFVSATQLTAQIAKETIVNAGTLKLTVVNPDQTKTGPVDFVVSETSSSSDAASASTAASTSTSASVEQPVTGEGGDPDLIDGCDVDMKADTPDEDLPITEGGVT